MPNINYCSDNPYKMDMIREINVAALTEKNAHFIEAVISLDSNYKKESKETPPDPDLDLETNS